MKEKQLKNKHHHFYEKYIKSYKLDIFTNLLKAATERTWSFYPNYSREKWIVHNMLMSVHFSQHVETSIGWCNNQSRTSSAQCPPPRMSYANRLTIDLLNCRLAPEAHLITLVAPHCDEAVQMHRLLGLMCTARCTACICIKLHMI